MKRYNFLTNLKIGWQIGYPMIFAMLATMGIIVVDNIMLGRLGAKELAAGALLNEALFVITFFCNFTLFAVGINTAKLKGEKKYNKISHEFSQGLYLAIFLAVFVIMIALLLPNFFMSIGQKKTIIDLSTNYLLGHILGLPAILLFALCRHFSNALFKTRLAFKTIAIALPLDAFLNYILGYGIGNFEGWGIFGIGLASTLTNWFTVWYIYQYMKNDHHIFPYLKLHRIDIAKIKELLKIGIPIGGAKALEIFMFFMATMMIGLLNTSALAAHTIVTYYGATMFCIMGGYAQGTSIRISEASGKKDDIIPIFLTNIVPFLSVVIMLTILFLGFPSFLVNVYIDYENPYFDEILSFAKIFFIFYLFYLSIDMIHFLFYISLNGLKDTFFPMVTNMIFLSIVATITGYFLAFYTEYDVYGVWIGLITGVFLASIVLILRFLYIHKKYNKLCKVKVSD